jgi:hypothetical protein
MHHHVPLDAAIGGKINCFLEFDGCDLLSSSTKCFGQHIQQTNAIKTTFNSVNKTGSGFVLNRRKPYLS